MMVPDTILEKRPLKATTMDKLIFFLLMNGYGGEMKNQNVIWRPGSYTLAVFFFI